MMQSTAASRLASSLVVGASFGLLLTSIAWYGFIIHANDRNTETLQSIETSVIGVVEQNQTLIEDNQRMLKEIQASMLERTTRLEEIKALLEKR